MKKEKYKTIIFILLILILSFLFNIYFGEKYRSKTKKIIKINNEIIVKNEVNKFLIDEKIKIKDEYYFVKYNDDGEIIDAGLRMNEVNQYIGSYVENLSNNLNKKLKFKNMKKYYRFIKINDNQYIYFPLGIIYNNPFIYYNGPKIILNYCYEFLVDYSIDTKLEQYGLNNTLIKTYLKLNIYEKEFQPSVSSRNIYKHKVLLSSKLINGRVSNFLETKLSSS